MGTHTLVNEYLRTKQNISMFFLFLCLFPVGTLGHGSLIEPPSRSVMNMYGFHENPVDWNWGASYCGGRDHQHSSEINGRCGICGDPWDANPREHEAPNGKYANGIITRNYQPGSEINVTVRIKTNHKGYFMFRLCKNDNVKKDPDQSCFDNPDSLLRISSSGSDRFNLTTPMGEGKNFSMTLRLPNIQCDQCIIQWTYTTGHNSGICGDGSDKLGCGPQETFRACSDISIDGKPVKKPSTQPKLPENSTLTLTNQPIVPTGRICTGAGAWKGDANMANWCNTNCNHVPSNCPTSTCQCQDSVKPVESKECLAIGPWTGNTAMNTWCEVHCPALCPANMCKC